MSDTKHLIIQEVRSFFRSISWKKILTFLFFVLLSSIFWMMQVYRQKFEATLTIPIKYENVPDSIIFDHELPTSINARIKDDGINLFRYYLTRRNDSLIVDVREVLKGTRERVIQGRNFEQLIRSKLFVTSELISFTPPRVSYSFAILHQKKLPVIYDGHIDLASGYLIDGDLIISPDSVIAYGSKSALDTLHYAHTVSDTLHSISSDKLLKIKMKSLKGIKYVPNSIELSVPVDEFTLKEVEVPITCINLPPHLNIKILPSAVKIPFFVGLKRFNEIDSNSFKVIIDYNDIKDTNELSIPIRIIESPDYIRSKSPIPSEVEFVLEQE